MKRIRLTPSRGAGLYSRPPLERMMRMHQRLKAGRYPNCRKLADELEVSAKTVQRDIDFMRYRLGLPIEYDQLHFGFYYTEPVSSFPNVEISEGELVALYIGQKALAQYKGTSFEAPLSTAFRKISDGLRDTISVTWSDLDSAISFRSTGRTVADIRLFEQLSHAIFKQVELRFDYKKPGATRYDNRYVQPYHLGCIENLWYLFAFDMDRAGLRTFALPRIRDVRVSKTRFRRPAEFSIGRYLEQSFGQFEAVLGKGWQAGPFCHGHLPTIADCFLIPQVYNARKMGFDMAHFPRIDHIYSACLELDAFQRAMMPMTG